MSCKQFLALFLWCHCYQVVLNPLINLVANEQDQRGGNIFVAGLDITVDTNPVVLTPGNDLELKCYIVEWPNEQFTWHRKRQYPITLKDPPEETMEDLKQGDDRFIINNNILILKSPKYSDVGDYYCRVKEPHKYEESEKKISVRARPYIHEFDIESSTLRSAIVEEGKSLKIPCNVVDDYAPERSLNVSWYMSKFDEHEMNDVISGEDGIRTESYNGTSHALIIDHITKDHRRFYKCHVTNGMTDNSKVILIRVKDKYTVIWPTVGIVIELVILIGVIFVVENRKVEPDKDTYDRKAIQM